MSDLEDDYLGQGGHDDTNALNRQLFGEESDDEQLHMQQQEQLLEDVLEDEQQYEQHHHQQQQQQHYAAGAPTAGAGPTAGDSEAEAEPEADGGSSDYEGEEKAGKKAKGPKKLKKKRDASEKGEKGDKPKKKKQRTEGKDKEGGKKGKGKEKGGIAANRPRRQPGAGAEEEQAAPRRPPRTGAPGEEDEERSEDMNAGEADKAFIDDEGVEPVPSDDEHAIVVAEEAEEAEDDELPFGRKKKKKERGGGNVELEIKDMLGKMEAAMETDFETVARNLGVELKKDAADNLVTDAEGNYVVARKGPPPHDKSPAISKLKLLPEVELFLAQRKYHESFLQQGGLGVLKGWLEPYSDGTLPNVRVRTAVLKCLQVLPIDTRYDDHKDMLRKSQLGKNVMFLFKCGEETGENRRIAKELVHAWSRPIFYDQDAEEAKKRLHMQQLLEARRLELERRKEDERDGATAAAQARSKAMRIHALIPRASKLDYVNNPGTAADVSVSEVAAAAAQPKGKANVDALTKRLREQQKRLKDSNARAMKPSVEGRNIVLMK